jgi:hypothetical protein
MRQAKKNQETKPAALEYYKCSFRGTRPIGAERAAGPILGTREVKEMNANAFEPWIVKRRAGTVPDRLVLPKQVILLRRMILLCFVACAWAAFMASDCRAQESEASQGVEARPLDAESRGKIIDELARRLGEEYVFPDVAQKMAAHVREQQAAGAYDGISDLAQFTTRLTRDLHSVKRDLHMAILPHSMFARMGEAVSEKTSDEDWEASYRQRMAHQNYGFYKVERLTGNVGYIDIREFAYDVIDGKDAGASVAHAAMAFLSRTDVLIVDLRECSGGRTEMIQLLFGYFFEKPVHFATKIDRLKDDAGEILSHAEVPGKKMIDVPIYVLTSRYTASGAEHFAYSLKHRGRAVIIGENTPGAAHRVHPKAVPELGVVFCIPHGTDIDPLTGTDWEGTGVEPDIPVAAGDALDMAHFKALEICLDKATGEKQRFDMEWVFRELAHKLDMVNLDEDALEEYVGVFGPRTVNLEDGSLYYQRKGKPKYRILPLGDDWFKFEDAKFFFMRPQFTRDDSGAIDGIVMRYDTMQADRGNH